MIETFLLIIVFAVVPLEWLAALLLLRVSWRQNISALNERALAALVLAIFTTVYFLAAVNASQGYAILDQTETQILARFAVASMGIGPLRWLYLYWTGRF